MISYYCIHHILAKDRKQYIIDNIVHDKLILEWIENYLPDCDFINNHQRIYSEHSANKQYLNNQELSCYYKHLYAIENLNNDYGLILEDDIEKPNFNLYDMSLLFADLMIKHNTDILFIGSFSIYDLSNIKIPTIICNQYTNQSRCAHAYMITKKTAQKLYPYLRNIKAPFDWQLNYAINDLRLNSCWSYPHIYQRTEKNKIKSLLR
jgi:GR25 family glycosyltransferase involved in LPS biosynthesis